MGVIEFVDFNHVNPEELLTVVNENVLRKHLVDHPYFNSESIREWVREKTELGSLPGCRIRAVYIDGVLAGWCGIQPDDSGFELAIVISQEFWGNGISVFRKLMHWAKELGHEEIKFHLLESRRDYRFLNKIASRIHQTKMLDRCFTTYHIRVGN